MTRTNFKVFGLYLNGSAIFAVMVVCILFLLSGVAMTVVGYTDLDSDTFYGMQNNENNFYSNGNDQNPLRIIGPVCMILGAFISLVMGVVYALACMADDSHYRNPRKRPDYEGYIPADKPRRTKVNREDEVHTENLHPAMRSAPVAPVGKKTPSTSSHESSVSGNFKEQQTSGSGTSSSSKSTPPPVNPYPAQYVPRPGEGLRSTGV
ncbi:unnamed protein product [Cyprideis torosa]|uniref:Uncharacterized protein n=1 Tax=Cyprideis torosa TaxID=163714 RepID=A0A7R8ZJR8_9CRUS|nr:unnamed protein product [Cyprideis torosa]CAG0880217.1 unnamed protein product [Cyprideis torosa]